MVIGGPVVTSRGGSRLLVGVRWAIRTQAGPTLRLGRWWIMVWRRRGTHSHGDRRIIDLVDVSESVVGVGCLHWTRTGTRTSVAFRQASTRDWRPCRLVPAALHRRQAEAVQANSRVEYVCVRETNGGHSAGSTNRASRRTRCGQSWRYRQP